MRIYQWEEMSDEQREVVSVAKEQTQRSYCPYSHFHVGAAALLANGEVVRGCNQENATEHRYGGKMEILLYGEKETYVFESAADLLPLIFVKENLKG